MTTENKSKISYNISGEYLTKVITYLAQRPYFETNQLIDELKGIIQAQNAANTTPLEVVKESKI